MRRQLLIFAGALLIALLFFGAADMTGRDPNIALQRSSDWVLIADDKPLYFGWDSDVLLRYDSTNARLETVGAFAIGNSGTQKVAEYYTSGTIAAGATSVTLTLPTGYAVTNWRLQYSITPAIAGGAYAGYGASFLTWEGGTTAEVRTTSATFINLVAELQAVQLY